MKVTLTFGRWKFYVSHKVKALRPMSGGRGQMHEAKTETGV